MSARDWRDYALCIEVDTEIFFPDHGVKATEAKSICRRCEVADECLTYALEHDEWIGVWGGYSERERRVLRRKGVA